MRYAARTLKDEIDRRSELRGALQAKSDVEEIERRIGDARSGRTKMLTKEEARAMLKELRRG